MLDPERMLDLLVRSFPADYPISLGTNDSPQNRIIYLVRTNKNCTPGKKPGEAGYVPLRQNIAELSYASFVHICATSTGEDHGLKRMISVMANGEDPIMDLPKEIQSIINEKVAAAVAKIRDELVQGARAAMGNGHAKQEPLPESEPVPTPDEKPMPLEPRRKSTHLKVPIDKRRERDNKLVEYANAHGLPKPSYIKDTGLLAGWYIGMVNKHQRENGVKDGVTV